MDEKEKEQLKNRILGIGTEVTGGIATDFATAALLNPVSLAKTGRSAAGNTAKEVPMHTNKSQFMLFL